MYDYVCAQNAQICVCFCPLCVCVCVCVIKRENARRMYNGDSWSRHLRNNQKVSAQFPVWLFIGYAVIMAATQTGSAAPLHDGQMGRKIKNTRRECADTLPNLFQALKIHTQTLTQTHWGCFASCPLPLVSQTFLLAVCCCCFFFEYLSLPFRSQTNLFCGCMTWEKATAVYTGECKAAPLTKYCLYTNPQPSELT